MTVLLKTEEAAVVTWLRQIDPATLEAFLGADGPRISDFSSDMLMMPAIAVDFVAWLNENLLRAPKILKKAAITAFPAIEEAPELLSAALRIEELLTRAKASDPCDVHLAGNVPIVNRAGLRQHLRRILTHEEPIVVEVSGESRFGRTHSWYLIRHVAKWTKRRAVWIDLIGPLLNQQRIEAVFDQIVGELGFPEARRPTVDGAAPNTIADRFATEIARLLRGPRTEPIWLVFDHLDKRVEPEIKALIKQLAEIHLRNPMGSCTVFLLGPGPDLAIEDQFDEIARETVTAFVDKEIEEAAKSVNSLGQAPLPPVDLRERIDEMLEIALTADPKAEACAAISKKLVALRKDVRA